MKKLPVIGIMIGDPAGIGPEVCVKAIASGELVGLCQPVLIGDIGVLHRAAQVSNVSLIFDAIESPDHDARQNAVSVIDPGGFKVSACPFGIASAASGRAVLDWIRIGERLGKDGTLDGLVMGPIETASMTATGEISDMDALQPPGTFMLRMTGRLRVVPLSEHVPLSVAITLVNPGIVFSLIELLDSTLKRWGFAAPRIGVAGINPHAMFDEDQQKIAPAVLRGRACGIDVSGPLVPDAVFRQTMDGRYDAVITMFHDQGQIPVKTVGFEGACTVYIGLSFVMLNVPHGTAYDIAGKGVAQHLSMLTAIQTAARLASGSAVVPLTMPAHGGSDAQLQAESV